MILFKTARKNSIFIPLAVAVRRMLENVVQSSSSILRIVSNRSTFLIVYSNSESISYYSRLSKH